MKAIILAAGRGSRMQNLTDDRPKCLIELNGKSLLDWQLDSLRAAGITEIAIVTGYKRELLANYGLIEFYNARWAETNMVTSLACAEEWLAVETCVISYSDIFYGPDAVLALINCSAKLAVTFDPNWRILWENRFGNPLIDAETFRITSGNFLIEIGDKPKSLDEIQGQYMGLLRITSDGWAAIARMREDLTQEQRDKIHMTGTLQKLVKNYKFPIFAIPYVGDWGEIDNANDLKLYQKSRYREVS